MDVVNIPFSVFLPSIGFSDNILVCGFYLVLDVLPRALCVPSLLICRDHPLGPYPSHLSF